MDIRLMKMTTSLEEPVDLKIIAVETIVLLMAYAYTGYLIAKKASHIIRSVDIGCHIENIMSYLSGIRMKGLCANMDIFGEGRKLDTNVEILIKFNISVKHATIKGAAIVGLS
jgi:hypothetical protein